MRRVHANHPDQKYHSFGDVGKRLAGNRKRPNYNSSTGCQSNENADGFIRERDTDRSLDGSRYYGNSYREDGRFGSHPTHDDYGEESSP
jgi:hypothetical protein